jgi:hypothetical protein
LEENTGSMMRAMCSGSPPPPWRTETDGRTVWPTPRPISRRISDSDCTSSVIVSSRFLCRAASSSRMRMPLVRDGMISG